jgi:CHAD domain-containing protein
VATERERWRLLDRGGVLLAEVVYDNVTADGRGRAGAWRTVRAEPHIGDRRVTDRLAKLLLHAEDTAKDTNLASFLGAPDTNYPRPGKSVADVLTAYLRRQVDALRAADVAARLDEPDGVHDLRVATRRLRACLRVFRRYFVADRVKPVTAELKWLSGWLGDVRDSEVLRQQIIGPVHELSSDLVLGPVQAEVDRHLSHSEAETAQSSHDGLDSRRYLALHDTLNRLIAEPPLHKRARKRAKAALSREIGQTYRKARTAVAAAEQAAPGTERDAALHAVRKKVRRLRYACEVAEPAIGKPAKKTARRSRKIQGLLGDHHDAVAARPVLRRLGAAAHLEGGNGFTFGVVHGLLDERAARQEADFDRLWQRLAGSGARRRLTGGR